MDLDNQNSTANTNKDSATTDFGASVDADKPSIDMDAINEAIAATDGKDPNLQTSFDVGDISLEDVPQSQDELDRRIKENPDMSLAGATNEAAADSKADSDIAVDPLAADVAPAKEKAAPVAAFVDGDIIDEVPESETPAPAKEYENINSDPLANFETGASKSEVAKSLGEPAKPTEGTASDAAAPAETPTPAGEPAHIANTIVAPGKKSKKPLIIGIVVGVVVVAVAIVLIVLTASK